MRHHNMTRYVILFFHKSGQYSIDFIYINFTFAGFSYSSDM